MSKIDKLIAKHCPQGVRFFELGEVCEMVSGGTPSRDVSKYWEGGNIPWITCKHLDNLGNVISAEMITKKGLEKSSASLVKKDSTIVVSRVSVGKVSFLEDDYAINQDLTGLTVKDTTVISPKYFYYVVRLKGSLIEKSAEGVGIRGVRREFLKTIKIPVPPVAVQEEIVKILDSYTECEAELKAQLEAEITARGQEYSYHRNALLGFDPSAIKNHPLKNLINKHCPKGVPFFELGEVCDVKGGKRVPKGKQFSSEPTDHPYIRVSDFKNFSIDKSDIKYISDEIYSEISRYTISSEDLYISIAGTIGMVGWVPKQLSGANLTENAAKIIIKSEKILKDFLVYLFAISLIQNQIKERTRAVGVPKLALERIKTIKIPVPPVAVQKEIVRILDSTTECEAELVAQLEAEITARRSQYEYCRNKLLTFEESYGV